VLNQGTAVLGRWDIERLLIQSIIEDRFHVLIGIGLKGQGSGTRLLQAFWRIPFPEPEQA